MTRALVISMLAVIACSRPEPPTTGSSAPISAASCTDCSSCPTDCDPGPAPSCPSGTCNLLGTCSCSLETASFDCPATGCCGAAVDADGLPLLDPYGYPVYQCITPACTADSDCAGGTICENAGSCGQARCVCPAGEGSDPEEPCCVVTNVDGVCCESGAVDQDGRCTCPTGMQDNGDGCVCPDEMILDEESGSCVCEDPNAVVDPETGACVCAPGFVLDSDPYTGESACLEQPIPCPDPNQVIDPGTGECVCGPGLILGEADDTASPQCVPPSCGDGVCSEPETCASCSDDCTCDPPPDAGDVEVGSDADVPDAGSGVPDAGCVIVEGIAVCHPV